MRLDRRLTRRWGALALCAFAVNLRVLAEDWPTYAHDIQRSAVSPETLNAPLSEDWVFVPAFPPCHAWGDPQPKPVEGILELPRLRFDDAFHVVAAGDMICFGSSSDTKVYALDAKTGQIRWEFYTEGPVRLAPTVWDGKVYAGSDDGRVYCLDGRDGKEIWRFTAAPTPEQVLGNGKMISRWPVRTGVLVDRSTAYFGAGVFAIEGLYLYAVDARTGKLLWKNDSFANANQGGISPQGYLVASPSRLFVPAGRTVPAAFDRMDGSFLFQTIPRERVLGGSYAFLAGDLLMNGTEHLIAMRENDGLQVFTDEARRLIAASNMVYLLTGNWALALERREWEQVTDARKQLNAAQLQFAKIEAERQSLEVQLHTAQIDPAVKTNLTQKLTDLASQQKRLEQQSREIAKWFVPSLCWDSMALTPSILFIGGNGIVKGLDPANGREVWTAKVDGRARGLAVANGRLLVSTDSGNIHCFVAGANGRGMRIAAPVSPDAFTKDDAQKSWKEAAGLIVKHCGVNKGYALILGHGTERLAFALAKQTDLMIYVAEPDVQKAAEARRSLSAAGVYGGRIVVMRQAFDALPFSDYFANLIVCQTDESRAVPIPAHEVLRMLKPCGGVACVMQMPKGNRAIEERQDPSRPTEWWSELQRELDRLGEKGAKIVSTGSLPNVVRGQLNGAGNWKHEYADAGNTACSGDRVVRGPLGILWYGDPGPGRMPSRHEAAASPLAFGGRMFVQGENVVMAYDAYNGIALWERAIPGAMRLGMSAGVPSNLTADDTSLFLVASGTCHRLDAASGATLATYQAPPGTSGRPSVWGNYVASWGGLLFGSSTTGCQEWAQLAREATNTLFALEIPSGRVVWTRPDRRILLNTICLGDGRMFFVEYGVTKEQEEEALRGISHEARMDRLGKPIVPDVRRVIALLAATGKELWERPQYLSDCVAVGPAGGELTAMYSAGVLVLCGQPENGHFWQAFAAGEFSRRSLIALSGDSGRVLWSGRKGYRSRPIIVDNHILAEPWAYDLKTGNDRMRVNPITGEQTRWQFSRPGHHCGNVAASPNALFFRSGTVAWYDMLADIGTTHLGSQRPGCWINIIPANGVVMMPEASSGCQCPYPLQCTTVYNTRRVQRTWGVYSAAGAAAPVKHIAIAFGAPGDRKAADGTLWLGYPRPFSSAGPFNRLALDFKLDMLDAHQGAFFRHSADSAKVAETRDPWLYASGLRGRQLVNVDLDTVDRGAVALAVAQAPAIDGQLADAAWDGLRLIRGTNSAAAWLRHNSDCLYLGFQQSASRGNDGAVVPWRKATQGQDAPVWEDHAVEAYFSDTNLTKCLHVGVSASGARCDALWKYVPIVFPIFDIPRLENIRVDGGTEDWGALGFSARSIPGEKKRMRSPANFDPSFRAGWNADGLFLLFEVQDDVISESVNEELWCADSIEIILSTNRGIRECYQIAMAPGIDPRFAEVRTHFWDHRRDPALPKLDAKTACRKTSSGYVAEVFLPWNNLGMTPAVGKEFGLQVFINDSDGLGEYPIDWFRASWHPGGHPGVNPAAYQVMRLADRPSSPVVFARSATPGPDGFFAALPPYPFPMEKPSSLGAEGEDMAYNGSWNAAVQIRSAGERDTEEKFCAEIAIPWKMFNEAGLQKEALLVSLLNTSGPLTQAPRADGWFQRLILLEPYTGPSREFAVRLHFAELEAVQPGERVFDVKLQGKTVLADFDIVAAAGGRERAVTKEIKGIRAGRTLSLELVPKRAEVTPRTCPILNALEIVAEQP